MGKVTESADIIQKRRKSPCERLCALKPPAPFADIIVKERHIEEGFLWTCKLSAM